MSVPQTVAEVLSKHVVLEVESIDRMYLNVYVPQLQAVEGALKFIRIHRGHKVASTRMVEPITREFVGSIERFAKDSQIPLITFEKGQRKDDFAKQQRKNFYKREGVVFIGKVIPWYIDALINQLIGVLYGPPRRCPCRPNAVRADYEPRCRE